VTVSLRQLIFLAIIRWFCPPREARILLAVVPKAASAQRQLDVATGAAWIRIRDYGLPITITSLSMQVLGTEELTRVALERCAAEMTASNGAIPVSSP